MFSVVSLRQSFCPRVGSCVTIVHDALDLTIQGPLPSTSAQGMVIPLDMGHHCAGTTPALHPPNMRPHCTGITPALDIGPHCTSPPPQPHTPWTWDLTVQMPIMLVASGGQDWRHVLLRTPLFTDISWQTRNLFKLVHLMSPHWFWHLVAIEVCAVSTSGWYAPHWTTGMLSCNSYLRHDIEFDSN